MEFSAEMIETLRKEYSKMGLYRVLLTTVSGRALTASIYAESLDDLYIKVKADYPELRVVGPDAIRRIS